MQNLKTHDQVEYVVQIMDDKNGMWTLFRWVRKLRVSIRPPAEGKLEELGGTEKTKIHNIYDEI